MLIGEHKDVRGTRPMIEFTVILVITIGIIGIVITKLTDRASLLCRRKDYA